MARVDYLTSEELPTEYRHLLDTDEGDPGDAIGNVTRAMANNPRVLDAWGEWAWTLYDEVDDARGRELMILAIAATVGSHYVWHKHVPRALDAGVSRPEIRAIPREKLERFDDDEQAMLAYAIAFATDSVDGEVHDELAAHVGDETMVAIALLVSEYCRLTRLIDALGVELESTFVGWKLEQLESAIGK